MVEKRRIVALALALTLTGTLTACSGGTQTATTTTDAAATTESAATTEAKTEISIAMQPYVHSIPNFYAEETGLYDEFDFTTTVYSTGPVMNEAVATSAWDVGATGTGGSVLGAVGYDMKIIGIIGTETNTTDIWVRPDSPILEAGPDENGIYGTAEDWAGKTILCPSVSPCEMTMLATLEYLGLETTDMDIIDMSMDQGYAAFLAGEADIVNLWSPFGFYAEREGWVKIASASQLGIEVPSLIVATAEAIETKPEAVQAWLQAFLEAGEGLSADPEMATEILYDYQTQEGIKVDMDSAALDIEYRPFYSIEENKAMFEKDSSGSCEAEEIMIAFVDFLISKGSITEANKEALLANEFVDGSFVENLT